VAGTFEMKNGGDTAVSQFAMRLTRALQDERVMAIARIGVTLGESLVHQQRNSQSNGQELSCLQRWILVDPHRRLHPIHHECFGSGTRTIRNHANSLGKVFGQSGERFVNGNHDRNGPKADGGTDQCDAGDFGCRSAEAHRAHRGELDWPTQAEPAETDHSAKWAIGRPANLLGPHGLTAFCPEAYGFVSTRTP
jgi:hypothetical protein